MAVRKKKNTQMFKKFLVRCTCFCLLASVAVSAARMAAKHEEPWSERIAKSFLSMHPDSISYPAELKSRKWNYEQGVMMEAFFHLWEETGDSEYVRYIKKNLDHYVDADGVIHTYRFDEYQLDNITPGKALLRMYEFTGGTKYRTAAATLRRQLAEQPRTREGGFWHKKIYPYQMWLDGMYMAEPFYGLYSLMTGDSAAFDDIAKQFILCAGHCFDQRSGLYFHGWDESRHQEWANPETGCSLSLWGRSIGWYGMGLVDALEYIPERHPQRHVLLKILNDLCRNLLPMRDEKTKLWYLIVDKPDEKDNYLESSASAMFAYIFAKGANLGYLPAEFRLRAEETFNGLLNHLVTVDSSGIVHLEHVCSVAGLGGNPYRDGSLAYYAGEPQRTDDFKGYGPFLMAAIELERGGHTIDVPTLKPKKTVALDYYFNCEWKRIDTSLVQYHYVWEDTMNSGFSQLGAVIRSLGAGIAAVHESPADSLLRKYQIYIIVDPDTPEETAHPNYMSESGIKSIVPWVQAGGVLVLMANDSGNAEFVYFNKLAEQFGIHFNEDSYHRVKGKAYDMGKSDDFPPHPVFKDVKQIFLKEICSLTLQKPAEPILTEQGHVFMAYARIGLGLVFAVGDPWLYNEYMDTRKLPSAYENSKAARNLFKWLLEQAQYQGQSNLEIK